LGYIGFKKYNISVGEPQTFLNNMYLTFQLFTLESGAVAGRVPWELEVARILAPIVPAWTLIKALALLFREHIYMLRLRFYKNHVVVCGLGRKGLKLCRDFQHKGYKVVVIEEDEENPHLQIVRDLKGIILIGDATDKYILQKARIGSAENVVMTCKDDGTNIEIAMAVHQLMKDNKPELRKTINCLVHVVDPKLFELFKSQSIFTRTSENLNFVIFNIYENAARQLLETNPLDREYIASDDPRFVELIILGFGYMGESITLQAAKIGHYANSKKLKINVIDRKAKSKEISFIDRYPKFMEICNIDFIEGDIESPDMLQKLYELSINPESLTTLVICLDNDWRGLLCALETLSKLEDCQVPIYVRISEDTTLVSLFEDSKDDSENITNVNAYGMINDVCTSDILLDKDLDLFSRKIHNNYVEQAKRDGKPDTDPSVQPWEKLLPSLRDSNRQQADHIPVKLRAINCVADNEVPGKEKISIFDDDKEIEILARMEHNRWNAERFLNGWKQGPKDVKRKISPYLVSWSKLSNEIQEYDRIAVRKIPDLLKSVGKFIYRIDK